MFQFFVWFSNLLFGLGIGLYVYEYVLLRNARKQNCMTSDSTNRKLKICSYWKWGIIGFVVIKICLFIIAYFS